ncbi:pilus assembly protein [Pseudomonas sp. CCM 7893]|uniref:Pilus assembly protein n=1 Tax=Pseudomonas spelaei TaxID=1055469 RepID=A0A6I3WI88_9PSED|nr:type II secretion system F family protein [Pseudomonas spelaei]MUF07951.1 pilus assembly protein [Pseudomonas spelaei]
MPSDLRGMFTRWAETFYAKQFGKNERIQFYESLMGILEDGVSLEDALHTVARAFSDNGQKLHPVSLACRDIAQAVKGGKSLSISCERWVPYDENSLIACGESTGNLVQAFRDCVRIIEIRQRIGKLVASATVFPSVVWGVMAALLYVIAMWMVPSMTRRSNPDAWTGVPAFLYALSNFVTHYGLITLIAIVVFILISIATLPVFCGFQITATSPTWKLQLTQAMQTLRVRAETLPPWSVYKALHGSIFLLNMAVMLRSGINQLDALNTLQRNASPWLKERLSAIHYGVSAGKNFGTALKLAGHEFPDPMAMHFLEVLAIRKGFAESMERFSNRWLEQTLERVEAIAKSLIGVSSMAMGIMMILVVIGIFQLASTVTETL